MKRYKNDFGFNEETLVTFHTGRGGSFYGPGCKTLKEIDSTKLMDFQFNSKTYIQFLDEEDGEVTGLTDAGGNELMDAKEYEHYTETGEGLFDFDGTYDTWKCVRIENTDETEMQLIIDAAGDGDEMAQSLVAVMLERGWVADWQVYEDEDEDEDEDEN